MKLKSIFPTLTLAAILLFAVTGCKKQKETVSPAENTAMYDAQLVIDDADVSYSDVVVSGGNETDAFFTENEGLPEAYTLIETDMDDAGFKRTDKRYFACIKKLNLTDSQIHMIRRALRAYEQCKAADIKAHRDAYAKLVARIEAARKDLLTQLRNGKITKVQFEEGLAKLRKDFETSLRYIKASYAANLKGCYDKFLRTTKAALTDEQWKAFVNCYR